MYTQIKHKIYIDKYFKELTILFSTLSYSIGIFVS